MASRLIRTKVTSCRILLAEDDAASLEMLAAFLKLHGHVVFPAQDGEQAMTLARTVRLDLVLTDICMPRLNGVELRRQLRLLAATHDIPVLAMTALSLDAWDEVHQAGFEEILPKPIDLDELERLVEAACDPTRRNH